MTAAGAGRPGPHNSLIDVEGIRIGHHTAVGDGFLTGTTVVLAPSAGMVAGVDVRGGGPATHETDMLHPTASVERIHAVVLTGGSAYGLAACTGVMTALADRGIGLPVGPGADEIVPLVPGAALFDLGRGGRFRARPTADFGALALAAALDPAAAADRASWGAAQGSDGAGTGAVASGLKGGLGGASLVLDSGVTVAALAVVNAAGSPINPRTGELWGARHLHPLDSATPPGVPGPDALRDLLAATAPRGPGITFGAGAAGISHTTLVVVATDAALTKSQCGKLAAVAQNGMARAINPVHTMFDGDIVFGLATATAGSPDAIGFHAITAAAADVVTRAIVRGLLAVSTTTTSVGRWPSWSDLAG